LSGGNRREEEVRPIGQSEPREGLCVKQQERAIGPQEPPAMRVINFFGAPGAGKSTAALGLAHLLKRAWIESEYVAEFAKGQVWSGSGHLLSRQNWVLANQDFPLTCLKGKVDFAVSDSPLPLSAFYAAPGYYPATFSQFVFAAFNRYDNINYFINHGNHPYSPKGRRETEEQAVAIANQMKEFLAKNGVPFIEMIAGDDTPAMIFENLREQGFIPASAKIETLG